MRIFVALATLLFGMAFLPATAWAELRGKYVATFSFTEKKVDSLLDKTETERKSYKYIVAFIGDKVLISADTIAGKSDAYLGDTFQQGGKKCGKDGTATKYCITYAPRQDGANVAVSMNVLNYWTINLSYRLVVTSSGCSLKSPSYKKAAYGVFAKDTRYTVSGLKVSCRKM